MKPDKFHKVFFSFEILCKKKYLILTNNLKSIKGL